MAVADQHLRQVERAPRPAQQGSFDRLQRSSGTARIAFKMRGARTVLSDVYQAGCCKVRFPRPEPGAAPEAVLLNTAGGLTDGDRLDVAAKWEAGTCAAVTSQAAERIYRSRGEPAYVENVLKVGKGATALWLPQEMILFDGGSLKRRLEAEVAEGGRLLACESAVFGRRAMGEHVETGLLHDNWRIRLAGRLVFADGFRLDGAVGERLARPALCGGAQAIASIIYVGNDPERLLAPLREIFSGCESLGGCSVNGPVLVARLMGETGARMRHDLIAALSCLLAQLAERNASGMASIGEAARALPRVWSC